MFVYEYYTVARANMTYDGSSLISLSQFSNRWSLCLIDSIIGPLVSLASCVMDLEDVADVGAYPSKKNKKKQHIYIQLS